MNKINRFNELLFNSKIKREDRQSIYNNIDSVIMKILELEDSPTIITGYEVIDNSDDITIKFVKSKEVELSYYKGDTTDELSPYTYELYVNEYIEVDDNINVTHCNKYELSIHDIFKKYIYKLDSILFKIDILDGVTFKTLISCNLKLLRNRFDNGSGTFVGDGKTLFVDNTMYLDSLHGSSIATDENGNNYIFGISIDHMGYISLSIQALPQTNKDIKLQINPNLIGSQHIRFEVLEVEGICSTFPYDEGDIMK